MNEQTKKRIEEIFAAPTPDIPEASKRSLLFMVVHAVDDAEKSRLRLESCRNELCLRCGNYKEAHNGACDGCRWQKEAEN